MQVLNRSTADFAICKILLYKCCCIGQISRAKSADYVPSKFSVFRSAIKLIADYYADIQGINVMSKGNFAGLPQQKISIFRPLGNIFAEILGYATQHPALRMRIIQMCRLEYTELLLSYRQMILNYKYLICIFFI